MSNTIFLNWLRFSLLSLIVLWAIYSIPVIAAPPAQNPTPEPNLTLKSEADKLKSLGADLLAEGDIAGAEKKLNEALNLYKQVGDRIGEAKTLINLCGQRQLELPMMIRGAH